MPERSVTATTAPARKRERLARDQRVRKRPEYLAAQDRGRRLSGRNYLLYALPRSSGSGARLGVTVSRKVGGSVVRNLVKRWVRESYRRMSTAAPADMDVVIIARPSAAEAGYVATREEIRTLLDRLRRP